VKAGDGELPEVLRVAEGRDARIKPAT
jgi:hypothetical protein